MIGGIFNEGSKTSMGRVLSLLVTVGGLVIGFVLAFNGKLDGNGVALALGLVGTGVAGKITQKAMEKK